MPTFWRIGNHYVNPAHIIRAEYRPATQSISGPDDLRVLNGSAHWSKHDQVWLDNDGERIQSRPSRMTIVTAELIPWESCPQGEQYNGVAAISREIVVNGDEADAFESFLGNDAYYPTAPERYRKGAK